MRVMDSKTVDLKTTKNVKNVGQSKTER